MQLFIQYEAAHATVDELGKLGKIQFTDVRCITAYFFFQCYIAQLNPNTNALQRSFVTDLKRADELERKLRFFRSQIKAQQIPVRELEVGDEDPEEKDAKIDTYEVLHCS